MSHILVDFDRTLAFYESWEKNGSTLGHPIPAMVERVKRWLAAGIDVRIFTARASTSNPRWREDSQKIAEWCNRFIGQPLMVTNEKDFQTIAIWDDRAVTVEPNTGWRWSVEAEGGDPLTEEDEGQFDMVARGQAEYEGTKKEYWTYEEPEGDLMKPEDLPDGFSIVDPENV